MGIADYQCEQLLGDKYHRLAPVFPPKMNIPMDDVDRVPYMTKFAEERDLTETVRWLEKNWM